MNSAKKILYIDMDDTIADFYGATKNPFTGEVDEYKMWFPDFFLNLKPLQGSKGAIFELEKMGFDIWILTQPLAENSDSYTDKAKWIQIHFPTLYRKIIMTQHKGLHVGHYLIDDNKDKWQEKFEKNGGKFVHYPYDKHSRKNVRPEDHEAFWRGIVKMFSNEIPYID